MSADKKPILLHSVIIHDFPEKINESHRTQQLQIQIIIDNSGYVSNVGDCIGRILRHHTQNICCFCSIYNCDIMLVMREFNDGIHGQENILNAFADFTVKLHEAGILHLDYSPGNILFKIDQDKISFSLVDLNRMHFGKLTPKQCLRNFERLTWDPNVIRYIVTEYAKKRH